MDNRVVIAYSVDMPGTSEQSAQVAGETFVVTEAATAKRLHPLADVLRYADGRSFVAAQDASLNPPKPDKPVKPDKSTDA